MRIRPVALGLMALFALALVLPMGGMNSGQSRDLGKRVVDIMVSEIWADQCRIWVQIKNNGNVKIDKVFREKCWVDGVLVDTGYSHYVLEPGAVFAHGVGADPGVKITGLNKVVKAEIDSDNILAELNEANNAKEVTLSCRVLREAVRQPMTVKSDLIVTFEYKNVIRKDPNADGNFVWTAAIHFTVTNQGAGASIPCKILVEKQPGTGGAFAACGPQISVPAINPGQTFTHVGSSYQHTGPAPTYKATVDFEDVVKESHEDNNTFTKKFPY